jgi:hypothetical protein
MKYKVFSLDKIKFSSVSRKKKIEFFFENIFFKSTIYLCDVNKYSFVNN